jgi:hypothetical protein
MDESVHHNQHNRGELSYVWRGTRRLRNWRTAKEGKITGEKSNIGQLLAAKITATGWLLAVRKTMKKI